MRPRHKAAENVGRALPPERMGLASMRPRHKAAENANALEIGRADGNGFNEAAA